MARLSDRDKSTLPREKMAKYGPGKLSDYELIVRTKARAVDGKSNEAVVKLLAKHFGVRPSQIVIIHGAASRRKLISVE